MEVTFKFVGTPEILCAPKFFTHRQRHSATASLGEGRFLPFREKEAVEGDSHGPVSVLLSPCRPLPSVWVFPLCGGLMAVGQTALY